MAIDLVKKAQIEAQGKAQVAALLFDEASTVVPTEYSDYSNVFSVENVMELPEYISINDYTIILKEDKQLPFELIYSLGPVEL